MSIAPASPRSGSTAMPQAPSLKRRRVSKACQRCRKVKTKCDGQQPVCSHCQGYGYACTWSENENSRSSIDTPKAHSPPAFISEELRPPSSSEYSAQLRQAIQSYEKLMNSLRLSLNDSSRAAVDLTLSHIRHQLPEDVTGAMEPESNSAATAVPGSSTRDGSSERTSKRRRYLGEASEIHFFHMVKQVLGDKLLLEHASDNDIQSYEQEELPFESPNGHGGRLRLPPKAIADKYIDIYFCTIHNAYPFIHKPSFMAHYEKLWKGDFDVGKTSSWLPLLYTIFAIGAYYFSFPYSENAESQTYLQYFEQAFSLGSSIMTDSSLENIHMLLAQCFFLLATGQSDRCWNILGLAVRVGQSIGLHVEDSLKRSMMSLSLLEQETMRRTWYSMYVLDRLLALQFGRPVAIHEEEYCTNLPSKAEETAFDVNGEDPPSPLGDRLSPLDYFYSVVKFSQIVSQVISDLYRPSQVRMSPDQMLLSTTTLDKKLSEWKLDLPRHLRFDLGHTFEKSVIFRRQRNMLAIKFHHLRTLMHRPYLCLAWLQRDNRPLIALLERAHDRVHSLERICVYEAQQTAHLLHNVADEESLVHDFPWWQMISCLLCASSVLLVARACIEPNRADAKVQSQALDEDAETCLKVFDALSVNSEAARLARDMMKSLKRIQILPSPETLVSQPLMNENLAGSALDMSLMSSLAYNNLDQVDYGIRHEAPEWETWPGLLSDPMAWSAQFINSSQSLHFNAVPMSPTDIPLYAHTEEDALLR